MKMIKLIRELAMGCMLSLVFVSCSEDTRKFQSNTFAELDSFVSSVEGNGGCMGAISVYDGTEEAYGRSWGYSNVMNQVPNGEETCYRLGSVSNLYTAVVVMKLIEDGKLSLDSKLSEFFPSIVQAPKITVEDMLRHRSGIFNIFFDLNYWSYYRTSMSKEELVSKIQSHGLVSAPGSKSQVSASNYILLSMIAEQVSGQSYGKLVDSLICVPLGLKYTYDGNYEDSKEGAEANSYYDKKPDWNLADKTNLSTVYGESSMISTPSEVAKFVSAVLAGKIVSLETLEKMEEFGNGMGIGFYQKNNEDGSLSISGNIDGFFADVVYFKKEGRNMVAVCLLNGVNRPFSLVSHVVDLVKDSNAVLPTLKQMTELSSDEENSYVGVYSNKQYAITFEIVKSEDGRCLKLKTSYSSNPVYMECYKNGEFSAEIVAEEVPVHFSVSKDKHTLFLDNGMELVRES